jgi:hypothetical protein
MIYSSAFMQAFAQVPDLSIFYGPDSYMGANIVELFQQMTVMTDEEVAAIHPEHNVGSIKKLLPRLYYYQVRSLGCFKTPRKNSLYVLHLYGFLLIFST